MGMITEVKSFEIQALYCLQRVNNLSDSAQIFSSPTGFATGSSSNTVVIYWLFS